MIMMKIYHMMTIKRPNLLKELTLIIYPMIQKLGKTSNTNKNNKKNKKSKNSKLKKIIIIT